MKKTISLSGRVVMPLKEGSRAIIAYGGDFIYTSRVVNIIEVGKETAHFETMNIIYKVSLIPHSALLPIPAYDAKSA